MIFNNSINLVQKLFVTQSLTTMYIFLIIKLSEKLYIQNL